MWISLSVSYPPTTDDRREQEKAQKAHYDWKVRGQNGFHMIRVNMDDETCRSYGDIKMSSALLQKIRENFTKMRSIDIEAIEAPLFTQMFEDSGTVLSYYDELRVLFDDLKSCSQPKFTN